MLAREACMDIQGRMPVWLTWHGVRCHDRYEAPEGRGACLPGLIAGNCGIDTPAAAITPFSKLEIA